LRAHRYCAAYYIAGYAVECALKSCIAKRTNRHDFPDRKLVNDSHTHDLAKLVSIAELKGVLEAANVADKDFGHNWDIVKDWSEQDRYNPDISRAKACELYDAITERRTGVLTWIKSYW
jgi:hypothetical protein